MCVRFHPNANYVVTGSMDKTVRVWDVQTGNCVRLLAGHSGNVTCVAVSPSGRQVCLAVRAFSAGMFAERPFFFFFFLAAGWFVSFRVLWRITNAYLGWI